MRENKINGEVSRDPIQVVAIVGVAVVAVVAAVVSFEHMRSVAQHAGESWRSWLFPISVDGMVIAATAAAWSARRAGEQASGWTVTSLTTGLLVSVGANVLAPFLPDPEAYGWLAPTVAAWPPIALALAAEQVAEIVKLAGKAPGGEDVSDAPELVSGADVAALGREAQTVKIVRPAAPEDDPEWVRAVEWAQRAIRSGTPISGYVIGKALQRSDEWGQSAFDAAKRAVQDGDGLRKVA